ncbi:Catalase-peroxidase [Bienertia sinuspersici]
MEIKIPSFFIKKPKCSVIETILPRSKMKLATLLIMRPRFRKCLCLSLSNYLRLEIKWSQTFQYLQDEISLIRRIHNSGTNTPDFWTWHYSKNGYFGVHSAYFIEVGAGRGRKSKTPSIRRYGQSYGCLISPLKSETSDGESFMVEYMFRRKAQIIWKASPLRLECNEGAHDSFVGWYVSLRNIYKEELWWRIFWCLTWGIWLKRNAWKFEKKENEDGGSHSQSFELDVAFFNSGKMGFGAVVRDAIGDIMLSAWWRVDAVERVDVAEAMALMHALKVSMEAGIRSVVLETVNVKVFHLLSRKDEDNSEIRCVIDDILSLAGHCTFCNYSHVKRAGNFCCP